MKTRIALLGLSALAALAVHTSALAASTSSVVPPPNQPYLVISNSPNAVFLTAYNTVPSVSYQIQTNTDVTNPNGWGTWVTVTAGSTVTPLSSLGLDFKEIFFRAIVLSSNAPGFSPNPQQSLYLGKLDLNTATNQNPELTAGKSQSDQSLPKWGRIINPDGDCNFYLGKDGVVISVPGGPHDLAAEIDRTNAPRVLQDVEGDFSIQVRTDGRFEPGEISTQGGRKSYNGAALIVTLDPENVVTLARAVFQTPGHNPAYYANFEIRSGGKLHRMGLTGDCRLPADGPVFLQLERHGSEIIGAISLNGADWQPLGKKDLPSTWPAKLSAGIAAISTSESEFDPRFSDLQISR